MSILLASLAQQLTPLNGGHLEAAETTVCYRVVEAIHAEVI